MKSLQKILAIFALGTICSCNNPSANNSETVINENIVSDTIASSSDTIKNKQANPDIPKDTITKINFQELSVTINGFTANDKYEEMQKDTVKILFDYGEGIFGKQISILSDQLKNIFVEQCYETSIAIANDGPHCGLTDWKHFYSDWGKLKTNEEGRFICNTYTQKECEKFPKISIEELKKEVKKNCGEGWFKLLEKIKSPTDDPVFVGISKYYLKITGYRKDNGKPVTKLIVFDIPLGC